MLHAAFTAYQRSRWMRPDAARFVRPDAAKFLKPGTDPADVYPGLPPTRSRVRRDLDAALAQEHHVLDAMRRDLAHIKSELAWRALLRAVAQKYNADQPRVPAGQTGGGQWTSGSGGRPRVHIYRTNPDAESDDGGALDEIVVDGSDDNPGFDVDVDESGEDDTRIPVSNNNVDIRDLIKPVSSSSQRESRPRDASIYDHRLASNEDRPKLGRNFSIATLVTIGERLIRAFRSENQLYDLFNLDRGTVSYTRLDDRNIFGSNSTSPTYTAQDRDAADSMRDVLVQKYPEVMKADNIGQKPNDALYHAETNVLLRSAKENGGTLAGRSVEIYVDRPMCSSCQKIIPLVGLEIGNPEITIVDKRGIFKIHDGKISRRPQ